MTRSKKYIMPSGRLFFDPLDDSGDPTGEFYIGNTTDGKYKVEEERAEQFGASGATMHKEGSFVTREDNVVEFTTDDIQPETLEMMFRGSAEIAATLSGTAVVETISNVRRGRYYQIGKTADSPGGARHITVTSVENDQPITIPAAINYEVDSEMGRLYILETAPDVVTGITLTVTYDIAASSREVITATDRVFRGALRYIADNTFGENRDHYWPLVELSPDGTTEMKGLDWREVSFQGLALKKPGFEKHYIDGRVVSADLSLFELKDPTFKRGFISWRGSGTARSIAANGGGPYVGFHCIYAGGNNSNSDIYQSLPVPTPWHERIDAEEVAVAEFSAFHQSLATQGDNGNLFVSFYNEAGGLILRVNGASHQSAEWEEVVMPETAVPALTRTIRFGARSLRADGFSNDNYWDNFSRVGLVWSPV